MEQNSPHRKILHDQPCQLFKIADHIALFESQTSSKLASYPGPLSGGKGLGRVIPTYMMIYQYIIYYIMPYLDQQLLVLNIIAVTYAVVLAIKLVFFFFFFQASQHTKQKKELSENHLKVELYCKLEPYNASRLPMHKF